MKIWFDSEGLIVGGKRYFAVVEEVMIDKDGKVVAYAAPVAEPEPEVEEPVVEAAAEEVVEEAAAEEVVEEAAAEEVVEEAAEEVVEEAAEETEEEVVEEVQETIVVMPDNTEIMEKLDEIIELLKAGKREEVITILAPEVVEEPAEEVVEEAAPEVVEEQPAEEELAATAVEEIAEEAIPVIDPTAISFEPVESEQPVKVVVRSPSFAEKMARADEVLQDRYDELKNYALRFRKLKSRISKKFDSINQGRFQFVKLSVAGKTLKLYLNMDINTTDPKFHCKDMSDKKTYVTVPTLLRIKSGRAVKYAKILIDQCAQQHGMLERRKPFVVDAMALIEEALKAKEAPEAEVENDEVMGDAE